MVFIRIELLLNRLIGISVRPAHGSQAWPSDQGEDSPLGQPLDSPNDWCVKKQCRVHCT